MNNNMQPIIKATTKIPFFRRAVLQNFPFIEKDFDALTDYELLCKVVEYLNKVIEQTNLMEDNENELVRVYNELYNYVENYFDNLDVQEEINNKLDAMVQDGTLEQIIEQYLNSSAIWGFDTVNDMKLATNLINGSYTKTLGYYNINDDGGAIYLIRTKTNDDIEDSGSIHFINNNLVAEIVANNCVNVKQFGAKGDGLTDDTNKIQNCIDFAKNEKKVIIPKGIYMISNIHTLAGLSLEGINKDESILKSIANNTISTGLLSMNYTQIPKCYISNITLDGNKDNNINVFDGIYLNSDSYIGDAFSILENISIKNFTGNGLSAISSEIREIKILNVKCSYNNLNGFYITGVTDSFFAYNIANVNKMNGFYFAGGNHKISNCKSFTNGRGDETTIEDLNRIPTSAFTITSDITPLSNKKYYTRSGTAYNNNPYVFTEFTGDSFVSGTDYYEMTTKYYKRYSGFYIHSRRSVINNCEAQDNFGDGFYLDVNNVNLTNILGDGNGYLVSLGGEINDRVSYASLGMEQLYDGVHVYNCNSNVIIGTFTNFRYNNELGAFQRTGLCIVSCIQISADITNVNQKTNDIIIYYNFNKLFLVNNGKENTLNYDLDRLTLPLNYSIYSSGIRESFLKTTNEKVSLNFIITNPNNIIADSSTDVVLFTLPDGYRPDSVVDVIGILSDNKGWNHRGTCTVTIKPNGQVSFRATGSYEYPDLIISAFYIK